jgi:hypothetical protein
VHGASIASTARAGDARCGTRRGAVGSNFGIDELAPAADNRGYVTVNASDVLGNYELSFGLARGRRTGASSSSSSTA